MQFVRRKEVNCFHISAMVGWDYKGPLIFYNTPEITAKGKVKGRKRASKKGEKAATKEAVADAICKKFFRYTRYTADIAIPP